MTTLRIDWCRLSSGPQAAPRSHSVLVLPRAYGSMQHLVAVEPVPAAVQRRSGRPPGRRSAMPGFTPSRRRARSGRSGCARVERDDLDRLVDRALEESSSTPVACWEKSAKFGHRRRGSRPAGAAGRGDGCSDGQRRARRGRSGWSRCRTIVTSIRQCDPSPGRNS